jgi:predicted tellurium resistance membrane protein TerC
LVIIGLLISVPIMIAGSTLILRWVERYPVIIYFGAAVLAWTAAKMLHSEPMLSEFFSRSAFAIWLTYGLVIGGIILSGLFRNAPIKPTHREGMPRHP